jgi:hypothetical protein
MRGTLYVDDISMTGKFNKEISYTKKERNGLPIKPLLELEKIQFPSQINDEKISRTINLNPEYLDTVTMFFLHAKGEGKIRITVEIIDYHGYRTTVARSATRDLTEEFQYVPTDLGVILDRSDSLVINIEVTGTAEISLEEDSE